MKMRSIATVALFVALSTGGCIRLINPAGSGSATSVEPQGSVGSLGSSSLLNLVTHQDASYVIGQIDFLSQASAVTQTGLDSPQSVSVNSDTIFVVDNWNHRVMAYSHPISGNGPSANFVLGQTSFTSSATGNGLNEMHNPESVQVFGPQLFVTDQMNNRVLVWNSLPNSNGAPASFEIGDNLTGACTATALNNPEMSFTDGSHFLISDINNKRILIYNSIPTSPAATPNLVLGQSSFTDCTGTSMTTPRAVWTNGTILAVADRGLQRVLIWNSFPTVNNQPWDLELGPSFADGSSFTGPWGLVSNGTQLFVSDPSSNFILGWNSFPTVSNQSADIVLGQSSSTQTGGNTTQNGLSFPLNMAIYGTDLWVADWVNKRVIVYDGL